MLFLDGFPRVTSSLLLIPNWIPWVVKYISCSLISWVDSLKWPVHGFLSVRRFLEWCSKYLSFYNHHSSHHLFFLTFQNQFSNHNKKLSKSGSILLNFFSYTLFHPRTIQTIIHNLRETPYSCTTLAYLGKTRKPQTSSKQGCFASNQTRTFPNKNSSF